MILFDILTLFPAPLASWMEFSILKRARDSGLVDIRLTDIRDFATDQRRSVDSSPYGGGAGMVMKAETIVAAVEHCLEDAPENTRVILLSPQGRRLDQSLLEELAQQERILILCGHYEGMDERVRSLLAPDEISLGDFVLTGGELAAAVIVDGVVRLLPGALGKDESSRDESFTGGYLEYPHYTRPPAFRNLRVPAVLLGGHHGEIRKWRDRQALLRTAADRPDLLPTDWRDRLNPPQKQRKKRRSDPVPPGEAEP